MSWASVAIGVSALVGAGTAVNNADSARRAAHTQADAANAAQQTQETQFNQSRADLAPWMQSGLAGQQALMNFLGIGPDGGFNPNAPGVRGFGSQEFAQGRDPSYQWRFDQGQNALLNRASAYGGLDSGNTRKALINYGQGAASQEFQNAFARYNQEQGNVYNRLAGVANTGLGAAGGIANLGANAANNVSSLQNQIGSTDASGVLAGGRALSQGLGSIGNAGTNWLLANYLQQQSAGGGGQSPQLTGVNEQQWQNLLP